MSEPRVSCINASCGNRLRPGSKFCALCGGSQTPPPAVPSKPSIATKGAARTSSSSKKPASALNKSTDELPKRPESPRRSNSKDVFQEGSSGVVEVVVATPPLIRPTPVDSLNDGSVATVDSPLSSLSTMDTAFSVASESLDAIVGDCENCLASAHLLSCILCERRACDFCRRRNLCNVCCAPGSWSKKVAGTKHLEAANAHFNECHLKGALAAICKAIQVNPQEPAAYALRAQCHLHLGEPKAALLDNNIAIDLASYVPALSQRMLLHWYAGNVAQAKADAEEVQRLVLGSSNEDMVQDHQLALVRTEWVLGGVERGLQKSIMALTTGRLEERDRLEIHLLKAHLHLLLSEWGQVVSEASLVRVESERLFRVFLPTSLVLIGKALQGCGLYHEAFPLFSQAVEVGAAIKDVDDCLVALAIGTFLKSNNRSQGLEVLKRVKDLEYHLRALVDKLTENPRDIYTGNCLRAIFLMDPEAWHLVPESRVPSLQRLLKVIALKQGADATSIHHPSHITLLVRVSSTAELLRLRVPPQTSVSALVDLIRMSTSAPLSQQQGAGAQPAVDEQRLFDSATCTWLGLDDYIRSSEGELFFMAKPEGTRSETEAELVVVNPNRTPFIVARFESEHACVMDVLRFAARCTGQGPIGYGLLRGEHEWLLPSASLASLGLGGTAVILTYAVTPCAASMLVENAQAFNSLSDCAFEIHEGEISAWGPGLGKFGYLPSRFENVLEAFQGERIIALAAGLSHVAAINADLQVVVAGAGVDKVDLPPQLNANVVAVACGFNFSVALTVDGRVCAWGSSSNQGQLGVISKSAGAVQIDVPEKVIAVSCGYHFGVAVSLTGKLYAWGDKTCVGRSKNAFSHMAELVDLPDGARVVTVSCGLHHALALTDKGEVWGWGVNDGGQVHPTKNGVVMTNKPKDRGTFYAPVLVREFVPLNSRVLCGEIHSMICVYQDIFSFPSSVQINSWGDNKHGSLGSGTPETTTFTMHKSTAVVRITCGQAHVELKLTHVIGSQEADESLAWGKCPHLLIESAWTPVSVTKFWLGETISRAKSQQELWEAARAYRQRYNLGEFQGKLDLSNQGLWSIPADVVQAFSGISEIDLNGNNFFCPPAELKRFPNLKTVVMQQGNAGRVDAASWRKALRDVDRQRSIWKRLMVSLHCGTDCVTAEYNSMQFLLRKLAGGLAFETNLASVATLNDYGVSVSSWTLPEEQDLEVMTYVHGPGADSAAQTVRSWLSTKRSVHVMVCGPQAGEEERSKEVARFRAWLDACRGPSTPLLVVVDYGSQGPEDDLTSTGKHLFARGLEEIHINSLTGLGIPLLLQRLVEIGRSTGLVEIPIPRSLFLLHQALLARWQQGSHCVVDLPALAATCHVSKLEEAFDFLVQHGAMVVGLDGCAYDPSWVGRDLCAGARAPPSPRDDEVTQLLLKSSLMEPTGQVVWRDLPATMSAADATSLREAHPQHQSLLHFAVPPSKCQLVCTVAKAVAPLGDVHVSQAGLMVSCGDEMGWLHEQDVGVWAIVVQCQGSPASSQLYPLLSRSVEEWASSYYVDTSLSMKRTVVCPECRIEKRAEPGIIPYRLCLGAFYAGKRFVQCSLQGMGQHRLRLVDLAPDIRLKFTPILPRVDMVKSRHEGTGTSTTAGGGIRGRLEQELVSVLSLDLERKMRFSDADPFQTLFLLSDLKHPNVVRILGVLESPLRMVVSAAHAVPLEVALGSRSDIFSFPASLQSKVQADVARGMAFLHAHEIVHGMLRPQSVCLDTHSSTARIFVPVDALDNEESWRFQPPEQLREGARASKAGDLYAFGMLLYIWSAASAYSVWKTPFGNKASREEWRKEDKIDKICEQGLRPTLPTSASESVVQAATQCWQHDPAARGTFVDILERLEGERFVPVPPRAWKGDHKARGAQQQVVFSTRTLCDVHETIISMSLVQGRFIWISTSKPRIQIFDLEEDALLPDMITPPVVIQTMKFIPSTNTVWAGGMDGTLFVWRAGQMQSPPLSAREHNNAITAICVLDHDIIITGDLTGDLISWRGFVSTNLKKIAPVACCGSPVRSIEVSKYNKSEIIVALSNAVQVLRHHAGAYLSIFSFKAPGMSGVSGILLENNKLWVAGGTSLHVFDFENRSLILEKKNVSKSKFIAFVQLYGMHPIPCTISVNSTLDFFDSQNYGVICTLVDEKLLGKFNSSAFLLGRDEIVIARDSNIVAWKILAQ